MNTFPKVFLFIALFSFCYSIPIDQNNEDTTELAEPNEFEVTTKSAKESIESLNHFSLESPDEDNKDDDEKTATGQSF